MQALREEAPALAAQSAAVVEELADALAALERFEGGEMAAALALDDPAEVEDGGGVGEGTALDERIVSSARRLEIAGQEVDGRLEALSRLSETVAEVVDTAVGRRDKAQAALELLAVEQRRASEEMKLTLSATLTAMERMQGQWDGAVADNAADLRSLRSEASRELSKREDEAEALRQMKGNLTSQATAFGTLVAKRQTITEAESRLKRRYAQLRQRRIAKQQVGLSAPFLPIDVPMDLEEAAEVAAKNAEKAAGSLLRFFTENKKESKGVSQDPAAPPGEEPKA